MLLPFPGQIDRELLESGEKSAPDDEVVRRMQLEQEQLSRIKGFESCIWRWPPEVHLIHVGATSVEGEPIPICYADEDSHLADRLSLYRAD
jgi:hypothetical protein